MRSNHRNLSCNLLSAHQEIKIAQVVILSEAKDLLFQAFGY